MSGNGQENGLSDGRATDVADKKRNNHAPIVASAVPIEIEK
jgi:hypothetical protein